MNKYANEFININNLQNYTENFLCDYFEKSYIKNFNNFESYVFVNNKVFFAIKPYIKLSLEYLEVENLFTANISNGIVANSKFKEIFFNYKFTNLENNNFLLDFYIKSDNRKNIVFDLLFVIKLFDEDFVERINICNNICFKLGNNNPIYIFSTGFDKVNYNNKLLVGKNIKKQQDFAIYFNYKISLENNSSVKLYIFSSYEYLIQFINLGSVKFIESCWNFPKFNLDIVADNDKIDGFTEKLISNLYRELYKSFHLQQNFTNKIFFMLKFDKSLIRLDVKDNLSKLLIYLRFFNLYNESFTDNTKLLIDKVSKNLQNYKIEKYSLLIDILVEIENITNHKLINELYLLKNKIKMQILSVNYLDLIKTINQNSSLDILLLIAKYCYYFDVKLKNKFINKLKDYFFEESYLSNLSKNQNINLEIYYNILYYLYDVQTKDIIFDLIVNNSELCIEKLEIIVDKIIGYHYKDNLIYILPNLPNNIDKILFNYKFKNGVYTVIAKRSADTNIVNDLK